MPISIFGLLLFECDVILDYKEILGTESLLKWNIHYTNTVGEKEKLIIVVPGYPIRFGNSLPVGISGDEIPLVARFSRPGRSWS